MKLLVLGGTSFVGRAIVEDALAAGHTVTLFSRGKTGTDLFPDVERRTGDRDAGDYASLADGEWDALVDVSGYLPRHVTQAADAVGDRIGGYLFISTGSVYDRTQAGDGMTEDTARLQPERGTEEINGETYGPLKVACEDDVLSRYGDRATIVRPGIVAGPHDPTDRFTYWVRRAAAGGRVALPGRPDQPVQVVDSRDLARLVVALLEADRSGIYNAVGPADPVTLGELARYAEARGRAAPGARGRAARPLGHSAQLARPAAGTEGKSRSWRSHAPRPSNRTAGRAAVLRGRRAGPRAHGGHGEQHPGVRRRR